MTTATFDAPAPATADPLREAIEDVAGVPEVYSEAFNQPEQKVKELVIVNWSGDLDKVWPVLILGSTAAASGVRARVFVTFWGLLPFVKDGKWIVGETWMQKMLTLMQRPGIDHLKLSKMNFLGMGPSMMGTFARSTTSPARASCSRRPPPWAWSSSRAR